MENEVWQMEPNTNSLFHPTLLSYDHPFPNGLHFQKRDLFESLRALVTGLPLSGKYEFNPLADDKILDGSKLKQIAGDILKFI